MDWSIDQFSDSYLTNSKNYGFSGTSSNETVSWFVMADQTRFFLLDRLFQWVFLDVECMIIIEDLFIINYWFLYFFKCLSIHFYGFHDNVELKIQKGENRWCGYTTIPQFHHKSSHISKVFQLLTRIFSFINPLNLFHRTFILSKNC